MVKIINIRRVYFEGWVYDLSTEAGVYIHESGAVLKNTDSVYVRWKGSNMKEAFALSTKAAEVATSSFISPIQLEFEKVMQPFMLFAKKRYAYQCWENPNTPDPGLKQIGTQVVRRDTCKYVRDALAHILKLIIQNNDQDEALRYTRQIISDLLKGNIDIQGLILTKGFRDGYANENIPHVRLARRMQNRNDIYKPSPGDRMSFVHVDNPNKDIDLEHPNFVKENEMRVNYMAYFDKQLKTPVDMIWGLIMDTALVYSDILVDSKIKVKKEKDIEGFLRLFHKSTS